MSIYQESNAGAIVVVVLLVMGAMACWCGKTLWDQMKSEEVVKRMRTLEVCVQQYAERNEGHCPDALGALWRTSICKDPTLYSNDPEKAPKSAEDVDAGRCDFGYLAKGMRMTPGASKTKAQEENESFPVLYTKTPERGLWVVVYSDSSPHSYEVKPSFLMSEAERKAQKAAQ